MIWFLIKGNISLERAKRKKPYTWLPDQTWEDCVRLSIDFPEPFENLLDDMERGEKAWKRVIILKKVLWKYRTYIQKF